jgi:hypothetical protein
MRLRRQRQKRPFRIESPGREAVAYWEGDRAIVFDAAWGVRPPELFVPTAERWDESVPAWARGRRDVILDRLRKRSRHRLVETDSPMRQELRPVPTRELAREIAESFLERAHVINGPSEIERLAQDDDGWVVEHTRGSFIVDRRTGEIHFR